MTQLAESMVVRGVSASSASSCRWAGLLGSKSELQGTKRRTMEKDCCWIRMEGEMLVRTSLWEDRRVMVAGSEASRR